MVYVMSDIHGNSRRFNSIMEQINLQPEDTLYVLGDVIDRHPDGIRILRRLMKMPNVKMLLGNHEYMMLRALGHPYKPLEKLTDMQQAEATRLWYRNGGRVTHGYWKHIRKDTREEIIQYLRALPLNYDIEVNGTQYKLAHAASVEEYERRPIRPYHNVTEYALWARLEPDFKLYGDYTLIFGHTQTFYYQSGSPMRLYFGDKRIGIDCGCGLPENAEEVYGIGGRLACLRLDDMEVFYSEECNVLRDRKRN